MESFKQLLGYVRKDFEITDEEFGDIELNLEFMKNFHKEFSKNQEKMQESLDFLDTEDFLHITGVGKWFKSRKEHINYTVCCNNLYALVCISQDILGNEMIKTFGNFNGDNIHEQIQSMFSEDSPLAGLLENSPLADLLKNEQLKPMLDNLLEKFKDIDIEKIMEDFQSGNFDMGNIQELLGGLVGGNHPGLTNIMNLIGPMIGNGDEEMVGLTPQQKSKIRRERKRTEYRRKIRAKEKARKKGKIGNRKKHV